MRNIIILAIILIFPSFLFAQIYKCAGKELGVDLIIAKEDTMITLQEIIVNRGNDTIFFRPFAFLPYIEEYSSIYPLDILKIDGGTLYYYYYDFGNIFDMVPINFFLLPPRDTFQYTKRISENLLNCDSINYLDISLSYIIFDDQLKNNKDFLRRVRLSYCTINIYNMKSLRMTLSTVREYEEYVFFRVPFNFKQLE